MRAAESHHGHVPKGVSFHAAEGSMRAHRARQRRLVGARCPPTDRPARGRAALRSALPEPRPLAGAAINACVGIVPCQLGMPAVERESAGRPTGGPDRQPLCPAATPGASCRVWTAAAARAVAAFMIPRLQMRPGGGVRRQDRVRFSGAIPRNGGWCEAGGDEQVRCFSAGGCRAVGAGGG